LSKENKKYALNGIVERELEITMINEEYINAYDQPDVESGKIILKSK
jgi:hypothetical protein